MQKTVCFISCLLLFSLKSFTQQNFTKSQIINSLGDTLTGYIDYKEWIKVPEQISFKRSLSENITIYLSKELKGFTIESNGETYKTLNFSYEKLPRSASKPKFESLSQYANRNKVITENTILVRQLSKGKINLYQFIDNDLENHLIIESNGVIEPLIYHIIEIKNKIVSLKQYQVQLNTFLINSCKKLNTEQTYYLANDIKKLVDTYNYCFEKEVTTSPIKEAKGKWEYGVAAGLGYTNFKYTLNTTYSTVNLNGGKSVAPVGSIFLNYSFGRRRGRYAILSELYTYSIKSHTFYERRNYDHALQYAAIQVLLRYKIYVNNPSVYILSGLSNGVFVSNKSTITYIDGSNENFANNYFRKDEQSYILGIGTSIKRFSVESRYTTGNGFINSINPGTPNKRIEVILKLNFGTI